MHLPNGLPAAEIVSTEIALALLAPRIAGLTGEALRHVVDQLPMYERNDSYVVVCSDPWQVTSEWRLLLALKENLDRD